MIEGEAVEHFAHIEAYRISRAGDGLSYLFEHRFVVNVEFYIWGVFAIDKGEVTVGAPIRTAIGSGDEFVVWTTTNAGAGSAGELLHKRRGCANHHSLFAPQKC